MGPTGYDRVFLSTKIFRHQSKAGYQKNSKSKLLRDWILMPCQPHRVKFSTWLDFNALLTPQGKIKLVHDWILMPC